MSITKRKSNLIKEVILEPTYEGTGLFNKKGEPIHYDALNISQETIDKIQDWIGWFGDKFYDSEDFEYIKFYEAGLEIAKIIKRELGRDIKVIYDDREVFIDESGNVTIEEKNNILELIKKLEKFSRKYDLPNIDEIDEIKERLLVLKFKANFNELPTVAKIGELELKSTLKLYEEFKNLYYDYCEKVTNFFETVTDFYFPDIVQMRMEIEERFCDDEDMKLNEEEFLHEYLYYFKLQIDGTIEDFLELFKMYKIKVGDPYESKSLFFTAYCSNHYVPIEEWTRIMNLIDKNPEKLTSNVGKIRVAEEIALEYHKGQPYGDHIKPDDYYIYHLNLVREQAKIIAKKEGIKTHKAEITALLHDLLEDTNYPPEKLLKQFGQRVYEGIKLLTYNKKMSHEEYLREISKNSLAKVIKAADRFVNIMQLKDIKDTEKREKLFLKYLRDYPIFSKYGIYPEYIEEAFKKLLI